MNSDNFESLFSFEVDDPVTENDISIINYKVKYKFGQNIYTVNVAKWDDTNSEFIDVLNLSQITKPKSNTEKINPTKAREILDTDIFELLPSQRTRQDDIDDFFQTFNTLAGSPPIFSDADGDGAAEYISPQESIRDYNSRISAADTPTAKITRLNTHANPINEEKTLERLRNRLNLYLKDVDNNVSIIPDQRPEYENKSSGFLKIRKPNQAIILRSTDGGSLEFDEGENSYRNGFTITMWVRFIGKSGRGTLFNYGNPTNEEKFGFRLDTLTKEHEGEYYRIVRLLVGDTDILSPHSDIKRLFDSNVGIPGSSRSNTAYSSYDSTAIDQGTGGIPAVDYDDARFFNHTQVSTNDLNEWFFICATYNPNIDEYSSIINHLNDYKRVEQFWLNHIIPKADAEADGFDYTGNSFLGAKCKVEVISRSELLRARGYKTKLDSLSFIPQQPGDSGAGEAEDDVVLGCMDVSADNYNPNATVDDGSCTYPVYGCMDSSADNYNPSATHDSGNCVYIQSLEGEFEITGVNSIALITNNNSGIVSAGIPAGIKIHLEINDTPYSVTVSSASGSNITITEDIPPQMIGAEGIYDLEIISNTPPTAS